MNITSIRDSTPGVHQSQCSTIPAGACALSLRCTRGFGLPIHIYLSRTGDPNDQVDLWTVSGATTGQVILIPLTSRESWARVFIKKGDHAKEDVAFDMIKVEHVTSKIKFEALAHTIKPEHKLCTKQGKSGIAFASSAPAYYAYFSVGFQRE